MLFIHLSRAYWQNKLSPLTNHLNDELAAPTVILFGPLSKGEVLPNSDVDLAILANPKKLDFEKFEGKLKRKIQIFLYRDINDIGQKELKNNIINGFVLKGRIR